MGVKYYSLEFPVYSNIITILTLDKEKKTLRVKMYPNVVT